MLTGFPEQVNPELFEKHLSVHLAVLSTTCPQTRARHYMADSNCFPTEQRQEQQALA